MRLLVQSVFYMSPRIRQLDEEREPLPEMIPTQSLGEAMHLRHAMRFFCGKVGGCFGKSSGHGAQPRNTT